MGAVESSGAGSQRSWVRDARAWISRHPLLLLVALGAAIRFATLTSQGFWLDEQVTVSLVQLSPIDLLKQVIETESNPSLYYLLLGGWERVLGSGEFGIRSFSALAGTAAIPLVFLAAKSLYSQRAAVIAAAITATSPLLIWYSQEARNYELLLFFAALSFLCFAKALDDHGHRWLWAWALAGAVALATHYFAFFLIVPEALWLLYRRPGSRIDTAIPMGAIVVVGLALLPLTATQRGRGDWIEGYDFAGRLFNVPEHFLVGYHVPWSAIPLLALGLVVAVAVYAAWRAEGSARRGLVVTRLDRRHRLRPAVAVVARRRRLHPHPQRARALARRRGADRDRIGIPRRRAPGNRNRRRALSRAAPCSRSGTRSRPRPSARAMTRSPRSSSRNQATGCSSRRAASVRR